MWTFSCKLSCNPKVENRWYFTWTYCSVCVLIAISAPLVYKNKHLNKHFSWKLEYELMPNA